MIFFKILGFLFILLDLRFFLFSRESEISPFFFACSFRTLVFLVFSILGFYLNSFEYLKCMTKESIFLLFYPCFFFIIFFTTHQLRPINANLGKCLRLGVPLQMPVHVTIRIISKGFNSGTR